MESGELERSDSVLSEAVERGRAAGEALAAADAAVRARTPCPHGLAEWSDEQVAQELQGVIHVFEELGDEAGLARALSLAGMLRYWRERLPPQSQISSRPPATHAAGDRAQEAESLQCVLMATLGVRPRARRSGARRGDPRARGDRTEDSRSRAEGQRGRGMAAPSSPSRKSRCVLVRRLRQPALLCERTSVAFSNATTRS